MPSTHLALHYHVVFATKNHQPMIDQSWRSRLHPYLGGVVAARLRLSAVWLIMCICSLDCGPLIA